MDCCCLVILSWCSFLGDDDGDDDGYGYDDDDKVKAIKHTLNITKNNINTMVLVVLLCKSLSHNPYGFDHAVLVVSLFANVIGFAAL